MKIKQPQEIQIQRRLARKHSASQDRVLPTEHVHRSMVILPGASNRSRIFRQLQATHGNYFVQRVVAADAALAAKEEADEKDKPAGYYPELGMTDMTSDLKGLARNGTNSQSEVILHQTGGGNGKGTLDAYRTRAKAGSHIGAHYLIDKDGQITLTAPIDKTIDHAKGHNTTAVGIEHVGMYTKLSLPASAKATAGMQAMRKQIEAMRMSPKFKERLLAMSDQELYTTIKANANNIYGDITGAQKRSSWLLSSRLSTDLKLDLGKDFKAHEKVQSKTIGEGENIQEFLMARQKYPQMVQELQTWFSSHNLSPELLQAEVSTLEALNRDGTEAENKLLADEKAAGKPGEATGRRQLIDQFYNQFYPRIQRVERLLALANKLAKASADELQNELKAAKDPLEQTMIQALLKQ